MSTTLTPNLAPTVVSLLLATAIVCGCADVPSHEPRSRMERTVLDECDAATFDTPPVLIEGNRPDLWRYARDSTGVTVKFVVTPNDAAEQISAETTGDWHMAGFAALGVRDWKFEPGRMAGVPVPVRCTVKMNYEMK